MSGQAGQAASDVPNGASPPQADGFVALDEDSIRGYIAAQPDLAARLGGAETETQWTVRVVCSSCPSSAHAIWTRLWASLRAQTKLRAQVREVGDGNINYVYILEGPGGALCVKQGHPYVRIVKTWALTQARDSTQV